MNKFSIGCFYSEGTDYEQIWKDYLLKSCNKFDIKTNILVTPNYNNWNQNVAEKPRVIGEMLELMVEDDECLVFLDADCTIEKYPKLFESIPQEYDIGFHTLNWNIWYGYKNIPPIMEVLSGTLFLRNNKKVKTLCKEWYRLAKETNEWEQKILSKIINNYDLKIYNLPLNYCFIDSRPGNKPPLVSRKNVVITHYQKSRIYKKRKM